MAAPDYYQVLGVSKTATADEIRKAYRKLARENHPDVKKDDPQAAERFKQIQEAYAVLGDPKKREQYDRFGTGPFAGGRPGGGPGGYTYTWTGGPGQTPIDLEELLNGGFGFEDLFGGRRRSGRTGTRTPSPGEDEHAEIRVPFETAARGGSLDVHINRHGKTETLAVKIPAGVADGSVIRLSGQGARSPFGGPPGDLLLTVRVEPHRYFRREGNDLLVDVPITPSEAVLGAKVDVPTLGEGHVMVTVPPGTSTGVKLRLRGKGVVDAQTKQTGDLYAVVKVVVPKHPSPAVMQLYRQLAEHETSPRAGLWS
uniref:J domain-containing protein n=1 Tax=Schlesneria paludicola TaxID=360056 RepID=A0A7C4LN06_9PLAN